MFFELSPRKPLLFTATTTDTAIEIPYDILTFVRLSAQNNINSLGNNILHESYRNRRHGTTTNAVYGRLSVFLLSQHVILERYFASACRLRKSRTPKDSKGSKGPRTPPHHSTSHCVPGSGHQVPSKTSPKHLQMLPRADRRGQGLQRTPKAPKDRGPLHTAAQATAYRDPGKEVLLERNEESGRKYEREERTVAGKNYLLPAMRTE